MHSFQNALEIALNKIQMGEINADQANVLIVQMMGVRVVTKIPADIRKSLNAAVKAGELGHIKKEGLKPEVYHHKNARAKALEIREREEREAKLNLLKIYAKGASPYIY